MAAHLVGISCSCVVHENVDLAPELDGLVYGALPVLGFGYVHLLEGESFRCCSNLLSSLDADVADENLGAFLDVVFRDALTKAGGGALRFLISRG